MHKQIKHLVWFLGRVKWIISIYIDWVFTSWLVYEMMPALAMIEIWKFMGYIWWNQTKLNETKTKTKRIKKKPSTEKAFAKFNGFHIIVRWKMKLKQPFRIQHVHTFILAIA